MTIDGNYLFMPAGLIAASLLWPKIGLLHASALEWLARQLRQHAESLDRAYSAAELAYNEDPPACGIERHWREEAREIQQLERMAR